VHAEQLVVAGGLRLRAGVHVEPDEAPEVFLLFRELSIRNGFGLKLRTKIKMVTNKLINMVFFNCLLVP
jgi:hypothetical protein